MSVRSPLRVLSVFLVVSAASCAQDRETERGTVVAVDTLTARWGLELFEPVAVQAGSDGSVFVLDRGNGELYRLRANGTTDTIAKKGSGPGELKGPTSFALLGDSAAIVADEGNARVQVIPFGAGPVRTLGYTQGAHAGVFDLSAGRFYAAAYGQGFAFENGKPVVSQAALVSVLSTESGEVVGHFGAPGTYEGTVLPIFGNLVRLARDPRNGDVWVAWPLEPLLERFDASGRRKGEIRRSLAFDPPPWTEEPTSRSPLPAADFQQVTFDVQVDSRGRLFVLTPVEAKTHKLHSTEYRHPAQAIEVLREDGTVECRVDLPVTATSFALAGDGELLLVDSRDSAEIFRVRYRCPTME